MATKSKIPQVRSALDVAADRQVFRIAHDIRNEMVRLVLQTTKSGRRYGDHIASAPGEPFASDSGRTVQSIRVNHTPGSKGATVSAGGEASRMEFGTSKMAPRPFMRPAATLVRQRGITKGFTIKV